METAFTLNRQVFVFNGSMNNTMGNFLDLITEFLELNAGNNRPLLIRVTSSGGIPEQIFGLCGLLRQVRAEGHEVHIHVLGQLCNFTYAIMAEADHRMIEPTGSFVFGQPYASCEGTIDSVESYLNYQDSLFTKLVNTIVGCSGGKLKEETVRSWRAMHITAQEALEMGLVDEVLPMPAKVEKATNLAEQSIRFNGSFGSDVDVFNKAAWLNTWLEDPKNARRPLRLYLTSVGGTVVQALSLFGMFCEAQRQGHHLTIHVIGEAYSCAIWFPICALHSGTVLIDGKATLMFHQPSSAFKGELDVVRYEVAVAKALYNQTRALLSTAAGFTPALVDEWSKGPDRYMSAKEASDLGLGTLLEELPPTAKKKTD